MKTKVIQLAIVPVFALSACTDDDPNRKATPTQTTQTQVVRHQDGSYSQPNLNARNANAQQPCQTQNPEEQENCAGSSSSGGGGGGSSSSSSTGQDTQQRYPTQQHLTSDTKKKKTTARLSNADFDRQYAQYYTSHTTRPSYSASSYSATSGNKQKGATVTSRGGFGSTAGVARGG